jgi:hypothetical protein
MGRILAEEEEMKCARCGVKQASIAIIDKDGYYEEDDVMCCFCFAKDVRDKLADARRRKGKEVMN